MARDSADGRLRRRNRRAWTRWESRFRKQVGQLSEICDFRQAADFAVLRCGLVVDLSAKMVQVCRGACDGAGDYIYNNVYGAEHLFYAILNRFCQKSSNCIYFVRIGCNLLFLLWFILQFWNRLAVFISQLYLICSNIVKIDLVKTLISLTYFCANAPMWSY